MRTIIRFAGILLLGGCLKSQTMETPNACALFSKKKAETILGVTLETARSQEFGENPRQAVISNCLYVAPNADSYKSLSVTVRKGTIVTTSLKPAEKHIMTMKQQFGQRYDLKEINGLADGAVWDSSLRQLTVFKGSDTYALVSPDSTAPDLEDKLVKLAEESLGKS